MRFYFTKPRKEICLGAGTKIILSSYKSFQKFQVSYLRTIMEMSVLDGSLIHFFFQMNEV